MNSDYKVLAISEDDMPNIISPEGAKIANTYLLNACSVRETANQLNLQPEQVHAVIKKNDVKNYIMSILRETGYQHMIKIANILDRLIDKKLEELEEAETGSNKDIAELLSLAHKMHMDMANLLQRDEKQNGPLTQNNTQLNVYGEGNYGKLMQKLITND